MIVTQSPLSRGRGRAYRLGPVRRRGIPGTRSRARQDRSQLNRRTLARREMLDDLPRYHDSRVVARCANDGLALMLSGLKMTHTGRWQYASRRRGTDRPANGGPNAILPCTGNRPHGKRPSRTSSSAATRAIAKLEVASVPEKQEWSERPHIAVVPATPSGGVPGTVGLDAEFEVLVCQECNRRFERMQVRGRKPTLCPACRTTAKAWRGFRLNAKASAHAVGGP
jgi:hypothetical protein